LIVSYPQLAFHIYIIQLDQETLWLLLTDEQKFVKKSRLGYTHHSSNWNWKRILWSGDIKYTNENEDYVVVVAIYIAAKSVRSIWPTKYMHHDGLHAQAQCVP